MSITAGIVAVVKTVSAWATSHKMTIDAALAVGEKIVKAKTEGTVVNLETKVTCLENEIEEIKIEIKRLKNAQKINCIVSGIAVVILAVLIFVVK